MPAANDREFNLQRLAAENGRWAEEELRLIEAIREHKRRLKELPTIIRKLRGEREHATAEMLRTGAEHDALEAEDKDAKRLVAWERARARENAELEAEDRATKIDKDFMDWANAQTDELIDWRETTRRPNY